MPYFAVDDRFHTHEKTGRVLARPGGREAIALWTLAGSWCADQLNGGFVPAFKVSQLGFKSKHAQALVESGGEGRPGLWLEVEGGYQFHDWADRNPTREAVEARRARDRERQARFRGGGAHPSESPPRHGVTSNQRNGVTSPSRHAVTNGDPRSRSRSQDQDPKGGADLNPDPRVRAGKPQNPRLVFDSDSDAIRSRAEVLLHIFERVVHDGKRVADEGTALSLLGGMLPALDDRTAEDDTPEAVFERVLLAYAADKTARGKTPSVRWFANDFAQWAQRHAVSSPIASHESRAERARALKVALADARARKRAAQTEDERKAASIAEAEAERELVSLVGPEATVESEVRL